MNAVEMYPASVRKDDNPFITILVNGLREAGATVHAYAPWSFGPLAGALHVHWLEQVTWGRYAKRIPVLQSALARLLVRKAKRYRNAGKPVVWTVHNLRPHESLSGHARRSFETLRRSFLPLVSDVILMSPGIEQEVAAEYPELSGARWHVIPLPHFRGFFQSLAPHQDVRSRYGIDATTPLLAVVGMLRRYKGIPSLIEQVRQLHHSFSLVVAGEGDAETCDAIRHAMGSDPRFIFDQRRLSDSDVASILAHADVALFNFESILNSASVLAALSMSTPVVCPASGALIDIQEDVGQQWVQTFHGALTPAILAQAIKALGNPFDTICPLDRHEPVEVGRRLKHVYEASAG